MRQKCDDDEFDFLHFHLDYYPFSLFARQPTPFLTTLHGRLDLPEHQPLFTAFSKIPLVSISNAQRRPVPQANFVRTIHHAAEPAEPVADRRRRQAEPVRGAPHVALLQHDLEQREEVEVGA